MSVLIDIWKKARSWIPILSRFLSLSLAEKVILFASGILLVRWMDKQDYAEYTVANSMLGGMVALASTGIAPAMMSLGGKFVGDRARMGELISTVSRYRYVLATMLMPVPLAMAAATLTQVGTPTVSIVLILTLLTVLLFNQLTASQYGQALQLARKPNHQQASAVGSGTTRLTLIMLLARLGYLSTAWVLVVTFFAQVIWNQFYLRRAALEFYEPGKPPVPEYTITFKKQTYRLLPEALSAFIMPQVMMLLLAFWGSSESVADLGAIGRITMVFAIVGGLNAIFMARLATTPTGRSLVRNSVYVFGFSLVFSLFFILSVHLLSSHILAILGKNYLHLGSELTLYCIYNSSLFIFSTVRMPLMAKGWTNYFWAFPIVNVSSLAAAIPFFDLSSISSLLTMNLIRQIPVGLLSLWLLWFQFSKNNRST